MEDEEKTELSFLEQVKAERLALEKVRDELKQEAVKIQELKAIEILSGKTEAGKPTEPKKELTPKEYADLVSKGIIPLQ